MLVEFFFGAVPAIIPKVFSEEKSQKTFFPSIRAIWEALNINKHSISK